MPLTKALGGGRRRASLLNAIATAGLPTGLVCCIDAGDSLSYPGSGQLVFDRSPTGATYTFGGTSGAEASDPVFNGTPGGLSEAEFFALSGGQFLLGTASQAWATQLLTAGNPFSMLAIGRFVASAGTQQIWGTGPSAGGLDGGAGTILNSSERVQTFYRGSGGSSASFSVIGPIAPVNAVAVISAAAQPNVGALLGANTTFVSGSQAAFTGGTITAVPQVIIGAGDTTPSQPLVSGSRLHAIAIWSPRVLTQAEITALYNIVRSGRFPSLPAASGAPMTP